MVQLQIGSAAPAFTGVDQDGNTISLSDYLGKKVVLYFYPKDDTPGCTAQACNLRDNYTDLLNKGFQVIGVSMDSVSKHKKFEKKYQLPFPLLADENRNVVEQYGVYGEKQFMGKTYMGIIRTTFLINEDGTINNIIEKPDTKNQTEQVLAEWKNKV